MKSSKEFEDTQNYNLQKLDVLGHFAGGIAHDFNNILSIIEGYINMAQKRQSRGEPYDEFLNKILDTTHRGSQITRQLLAFGRHNIALPEVLNIKEALEDQNVLLNPILGEDIHFELVCCADDLFIEVAPEHVTQIVLNLATNARDAMPNGGMFRITTACCDADDIPDWLQQKHPDKEFVLIRCQDTGAGIPEDLRDKIFDPFFTTKDHGHGTGLGLSTIYGLVDQMKGMIYIPEIEEEGAVFDIYLPLSDKRPVQETSDIKEEGDVLKGKTILIAEDEEDLRIVLEDMFQDLGMHVLMAENGNHALMVQDDHMGEIDYLLTDVVMPEMPGTHLAELFASLRPRTHIVFMSGYPSFGAGNKYHLPEDAVLMAKPLKLDRIKSVLSEAMEETIGAEKKSA